MKKVVFLDIDGVLNDNLNDFVDSCVESVIKLVDKNEASVVMITSLQGNGTKAKRNKLYFHPTDIQSVGFLSFLT